MKNKKVFIIASLATLAVILVAFAIFIITKKPDTEKVLKDYYALVNKEDYEGMYAFLSKESQEKISKEDFISRNQKIYSGVEASKIEVTQTDSKTKGDVSTVNYSTKMNTLAGELSFDNTIELKKEEDLFKINWSSNSIFPELDDNYKVRVNSTPSKRGNILDRNNKILATDGTAANVGIVPGKLGTNKDENIKKLSEILGVSVDDINTKLNASYVKPDMFIPIKVISNNDPKVQQVLQIPGIMVNDKPSRVYPYAEQAAHLTGYVQPINAEELKANEGEYYTNSSIIGKTGIEKLYESKLRGISGQEIIIVDEKGVTKSSLIKRDVKHGEDVKLTINADTQSLLYSQIQNDAGASVAMDPKTGEVLALVSTPSYNPNEFVMGMSTSRWDALNNDKKLPLYNRFQATSAPGSVFKPITSAIGLNTKTLNPNEDKKISSLDWQKDNSWGDYTVTRVHGYDGPSNLENAMINSDNIYFAQTALDIGKDNFIDGLKKMGFTEDIPFEYGLNKSQYATNGEIKTDIQLADSGYGQGELLVNPIHLASMYSMFVNDGSMVTPYLLYKDKPTPTIWKENVISKENSNIILDDMKKVISSPNGTGRAANIQNLALAGKTGTAEIKKSKDDKTGTELGWFAAMTTGASNSNLLVVTMVEDVKDRGGSGYVVPLVRKAFENIK